MLWESAKKGGKLQARLRHWDLLEYCPSCLLTMYFGLLDHSLLRKKLFNCHQSLVTGSCRKVLCDVGWLVCLIGLCGGGGREPQDIILEVRRFWVLYSKYQSPSPEVWAAEVLQSDGRSVCSVAAMDGENTCVSWRVCLRRPVCGDPAQEKGRWRLVSWKGCLEKLEERDHGYHSSLHV